MPARIIPETTAAARPSRRRFLAAAAAAGAGLTIGFHVPLGPIGRALAATGEDAVNPINAYLRIAPDSTVTIISAHMDGGQGIYTGIATLVADELDADWRRCAPRGGWGNPKLYGNMALGGAFQLTGGSSSTPSSWERYRRAGATARAMLIQAAAREWGVPPGEIAIDKGTVSHASGKSAGFGELAPKAATIAPPAEVKLKDPARWVYIGNPALHRLDHVDKTDGSHQFPIDVRLPGMLTAVIAHPPRFGGKAGSFDATATRQVKGVVDVVETPRGIAVVATDTWSAILGRRALKVAWDESAAEIRGSEALLAEYKALARSGEGAATARHDGDAEAAFATAAKVIEAEYEFPYLAHAAMEPLDAVARLKDGKLEVWAGHQVPDLYQQAAAKVMGMDPKDVVLHVMTPGGFFGRRAVFDADIIVETVSTLKAIGAKAPVKVQWTREDDMRGGRYRPMYVHKLKAGLDGAGNLVAWQHRIVGQSIMADTAFASTIKDGVDRTSVEGAENLPYAVPTSMSTSSPPRSASPSSGGARSARPTPPTRPRCSSTSWPMPRGRTRSPSGRPCSRTSRGTWACSTSRPRRPAGTGRRRKGASAGSRSTSRSRPTSPRWPRSASTTRAGSRSSAWSAPSIAASPSTPTSSRPRSRAASATGLGAVLKGEITLDDGRVVQGNFDGYQVLTIEEMPRVEVHIVPSDREPDRRRRARRAADRPRRRQRLLCRDRQAPAHPALQPQRPADGLEERAAMRPILLAVLATAALLPLAAAAEDLRPASAFAGIADPAQRSAALFTEAGKVIDSPRCVNCHPAGNRPLQGDDEHLHLPAVQRGDGNVGVAGLHCGTCHHDRNFDAVGIPGHPEWALAPIEMAWQGRSLGQICAQIKDPARNGGRSMAELVHHMAESSLVGWGWHPGAGRTPAPGTQQAFGELIKAWADSGAACPTG